MRDTDFFLRKYANTTTSLAFLKMPFEEFRTRMIERHNELNRMQDRFKPAMVQDMDDGLAMKLNALPPLTIGGVSKVLVCETQSEWCVYFENKFHGTEVYNQPSYYSRTWGPDVLAFVMVADDMPRQSGSIQFGFKQKGLGGDLKVRNVAAHRESGWEFHEHGEPLPFEELETYKARRIKDRLTPEMLEPYAKHFGIELFDPDFYAGRGAVITRDGYIHSYVDNTNGLRF